VVAAELHRDSSVFLSARHHGATKTAQSARVLRVRWSSIAYLALGMALASIAIACVTGTITRLSAALPGHATVHVGHPFRLGLMYLWFGALSFFAAWFTATQERLAG